MKAQRALRLQLFDPLSPANRENIGNLYQVVIDLPPDLPISDLQWWMHEKMKIINQELIALSNRLATFSNGD